MELQGTHQSGLNNISPKHGLPLVTVAVSLNLYLMPLSAVCVQMNGGLEALECP